MRSVWCGVWRCLLVLSLAGCFAAQARAAGYATGAVPAWVVPVAVPVVPVAAAGVEGATIASRGNIAYVLHDQQVRVEAQGSVVFLHSVRRALNGRGVEQVAHVTINFDPSYQKLTLHTLNVIRDGKVLPRLATARIEVLQRETELEYLIYDGSKTASAMLDDVRIGDVVEYSYSIAGSNPVFRNLAAGTQSLAWSLPVEQAFSRLVLPLARPIVVTPHATTLQPVVTEANGYRDYRWQQRNVAGLPEENNTPGWHAPYGRVQWSEFADWAAVVRWALPLYARPADLGPALREQVARIAAEHSDAAGRTAAVLQLVQREIRYLGIEVGAGSHAPSAPMLVYQRRFGDCKDKALLMVSMLAALGVDAAPALVNTELTSGVAQLAPTAHAFNHVLVRVIVAGQTYWLDPTRAQQAGDLAHLYQADYGQALVLATGTAGLTPMAHAGAGVDGTRRVASVFDLRGGLDAPVSYSVNTTVRGAGADSMRANLASNRAELTKQYVDYYTRTYPGLVSTGPLTVQDELAKNALTVVEKYRIDKFWTINQEKRRRQVRIELSDIDSPLTAPATVNRSAPLKIAYPYELIETVEVLLPNEWSLKTHKTVVEHPAFDFSYEVSKSDDGRRLLITAYYKALRDHVTPAELASYDARLTEARDALGYQLTDTIGAPAASRRVTSGWVGAYTVATTLLVCTVLWGVFLAAVRYARPEHRDINRRLFYALAVVGVTAIGMSLTSVAFTTRLALAMAGLSLLVPYMLGIVLRVPASHAGYGWARRYEGLQHKLNDSTVLRQFSLRRLAELAGWFAIGWFLATSLGGA